MVQFRRHDGPKSCRHDQRRRKPARAVRGYLPVLELLECRCLLSFQAPVFFNTDEAPRGVAVADLNGDGVLDVVTANADPGNSVSVLLGNGDGTLKPAVRYPVGRNAERVAVADLNGDGIPDLITTNTSDNNVSVLLGNGDGTFRAAVNYPAGSAPLGLTVGDFNEDGIPDLAVAFDDYGQGRGGVAILLGNGDGSFQAPITYGLGSGYPWSVAAGDLNGDGHTDLVVSDALFTVVYRLLGHGDGTFGPAVSYNSGQNSTTSVVVGDFRRNGILDVATANQNPGSLAVLRNNGNGTFQTAMNYPAGPGAYTVAAADLNNRGILDLVSANPGNVTVSVLKGNGDGTFQNPRSYNAGPGPGASPDFVTTGDLNGDGFPDLIVTDNRSNQVAVLLNEPDATVFGLSLPKSSVAGTSFPITVFALNPLGHVDPEYQGTVRFTSTDPQASLPATYTFTAADHGQHTFMATLRTAGSQSVTVTDIASPTITRTATVTVTPAAAGSLLVAGFPSPVPAGDVDTFTVTARDPYGNVATGYRGTVHFTSSDRQATLPRDYTFTAADNGTRVFGAVLRTAGTQTLTATDTATATISGTQAGITVTPIAADHFGITAPASVTNGNPFMVTVTARDPFNNLATGYRGTASFSSSDPLAALPDDYTFTAADNGTHTFPVTLHTAHNQTVVVHDTADPTITGSTTVTVAPILFNAAVHYPILATARGMTLGDFNGDGIPDLVTTGRPLSLLLGNGDGTFQSARTINTPYSSFEVAAGDFNGDGILDLVTANWQSSSTVSVLLGNGDGTFQSPRDFPTNGSTPTGLVVGDFNGDGQLDLAVTNEFNNSVTVFLGNGDGTLRTLASYPVGSYPIAVRTGDFNGDGIPDLVVTNAGAGGFGDDTVSVLLGNGDGSFQTGPTYVVGSHPFSVVVGDFNGDGIPDIATANEVSGDIGVLLGRGDGTFLPVTRYPDSTDPIWIEAADFNGDGVLDLVTANSNGNALQVFLGNGDGSFRHFGSFAAADHPTALAVGDLNGDGFPDLAAISAGRNDLSVLLNAAEGPTSANHSGDRQTLARTAFPIPPEGMSSDRTEASPLLEVEAPRANPSARMETETRAGARDQLLTAAAVADDARLPFEKRSNSLLDFLAISDFVLMQDPLTQY